ncbi:MAG: glycosyltransferase family 4 protein [Ectothiorhodospiraceae bacterium]|nr:glycosyltransferase family 4 protein [Chromatiales bacterium]MCP5156282.1 glycosyltransferase family 4 protein [Ectothiorhodospiraceae bacterium]
MTRPVTILTHEFFPRRGGAATYVEEMAAALARAGREVEVWAPEDPALASRAWPFAVHAIDVRGTQDWGDRVRLARRLEAARDRLAGRILYLPEAGPQRTWLYYQLRRRQSPGPLVLTLHGTEIKRFCAMAHRRALFRRLLDRADRIGVVSRYVRGLLLERFPEMEPRTVLAYAGIRRLPAANGRGAANGSSGSTTPPGGEGRRCVLLTVARIHPRKGQSAVVEALARLPRAQRELFEYRVVGPTVDAAYLQEMTGLAQAARVKLRVDGPLDDDALEQAYRDADVFVMTSEDLDDSIEGLGLVYLDAAARGLPVVAHDVGGVSEAVSHGVTGLVVPPWNRDALAAALLELAEDEVSRREFGRAGRLRASGYSWDDTASTLFAGI